MRSLMYSFALLVTAAAAVLWQGYALSVLWGWFVVPTFSAPALSLAAAIGVALIADLLTQQRVAAKRNGNDALEALAYLAAKPAIALMIGYLVRHLA